ncbi:MAG: legume-like lectin family-domain-containing protein [Olpidium bornovanus]|uniref:Legume-like lectin family-domain-containing protein n=1 Tax=Olpidium bornovanus TaxID=278681 RepID=A0A8H8DHD3_9FUNG|nr:MAG: legume-like lectin family-domain-containing protein [Olpidium bornovanus]
MSPASPSADSAREALAAGTLLALLALASGSSAFSSGTADGGSEKRPFRRHDYRLTFKQPYYFNNTIIPFWETFGSMYVEVGAAPDSGAEGGGKGREEQAEGGRRHPKSLSVRARTPPLLRLCRADTIPSEEYIRLTPSVPGLKGSIWSTYACCPTFERRCRRVGVDRQRLTQCAFSRQPNKHPEWEVEFSVAVFGRGAAGGEGLAFWYTKDRAQDGPVFGSKDKWDGLGIIFDTYDENASVSRQKFALTAVVNPLNVQISHLPCGHTSASPKAEQPFSLRRDQRRNCFRDYRNLHAPLWVRVSYHDKRLAVDIDIDKKGKSYVLCFEGHDISLPTGYYFGLSALAGKYAGEERCARDCIFGYRLVGLFYFVSCSAAHVLSGVLFLRSGVRNGTMDAQTITMRLASTATNLTRKLLPTYVLLTFSGLECA